MMNSELKFVAKGFSRICTNSSRCVHYLYTEGCWDDECDVYELLKDSFYNGVIDDCPIKNTELTCVGCSEKVWYEFLKQMEKKYPRKGEEKHDD